jgi:hypothetical protein
MFDKNGCLGCLGSLVVLTFFGSMFFGGGVLMRVGGWSFSLGRDPIDRQQIINYYLTDLESRKQIAEAGVNKFHTQIEQGQCQNIFDQASEIFKKNQNLSEFNSYCQTFTLNLGSKQSSEFLDWWGQPSDKDSERYILIRYMTKFSKATARETFIWLVKDSKSELVNYEISPITSQIKQSVPNQI